jgi:glycerophosphoryl diester phosphodiesterase
MALALDIQGHRGTRGYLPENTLPAFRRAIEMGVNTLELDVGVTRDSVVVVHHDRRLNPDLARGPDGRWVEPPTPTIHSLSFAELEKYDVGRIRPGSQYAARYPHQQAIDGTRIPRLSDLFALGKQNSVRFNIELKLVPSHPDETLAPEPFARALIAEVRKGGMEKRSTLQSFDWRVLKVIEREAPELATAYLTEAADSQVAQVRAAGAKIWSPDYRALTKQALDEAHAAGMRVVVWTVNEPRDIARLVGWGVDGIISDYPDRVIEETKKR